MDAFPTLYERIRRLLLQHDREHAISGTDIAAELNAGGTDVHRALGRLATKGEINRSGPPYKYWGNPGFRPTIKGQFMRDVLNGNANGAPAETRENLAAALLQERGTLTARGLAALIGTDAQAASSALQGLSGDGRAIKEYVHHRLVRYHAPGTWQPSPEPPAGPQPDAQPEVAQNTGSAAPARHGPGVAHLSEVARPASVVSATPSHAPAAADSVRPAEAAFNIDHNGFIEIEHGDDLITLDPLNALRLRRFMAAIGPLLDLIEQDAKC